MKSYVCKPILMTLLSLAVSLGTLLPMRSMVYFCQSVFLKICFVIALDVLRDLPTGNKQVFQMKLCYQLKKT